MHRLYHRLSVSAYLHPPKHADGWFPRGTLSILSESTGSSRPSTWGLRPHILYNVIPVNSSDVPPIRGWGWWNVAESTSTGVPIHNASGAQSDQFKTKKQLIAELDELRDQLA